MISKAYIYRDIKPTIYSVLWGHSSEVPEVPSTTNRSWSYVSSYAEYGTRYAALPQTGLFIGLSGQYYSFISSNKNLGSYPINTLISGFYIAAEVSGMYLPMFYAPSQYVSSKPAISAKYVASNKFGF